MEEVMEQEIKTLLEIKEKEPLNEPENKINVGKFDFSELVSTFSISNVVKGEEANG